jgi:hypothetical protein
MSAHMTPEQVRSKIDHPIVDGDGHWVEYDPVFSERMRKVGGDLAADGFLKAMGTTREALSMSVAERRHKRIGQPAFRWSSAWASISPRTRRGEFRCRGTPQGRKIATNTFGIREMSI